MKNFKQLTALGLAATLTGISGVASAATVNGDASATILAPIAVSQTVAMDFGSISGDVSNSSTATLDTADGVTTSADAWSNGVGVSGGFDVTGGVTAVYDITVPPGAITITADGGGGQTMTVDTFTSSANSGTIDGVVNTDFTVGATLHIGINQFEDSYSGTYVMTVNYQ